MIRINMLAFRVPSFLWRGAVLWGWGLFRSAAIPFFVAGRSAFRCSFFPAAWCSFFPVFRLPRASVALPSAARCRRVVSFLVNSGRRLVASFASYRAASIRRGAEATTTRHQSNTTQKQGNPRQIRHAKHDASFFASPRLVASPPRYVARCRIPHR